MMIVENDRQTLVSLLLDLLWVIKMWLSA